MKKLALAQELKENAYPGRGIVIGRSKDGKKAVTAYFIMGRSANSRNRVFVLHDGDLFTEPFDPARVEDPSLIIYAALRQFGNRLIVTNGDQTDTVRDGLAAGKSFSEAHLFSGNHRRGTRLDRSFDLHIFCGEISQSFIAHEHCDLFHKYTELSCSGLFVTHKRYFVLYKRVIDDIYVSHFPISFRIKSVELKTTLCNIIYVI